MRATADAVQERPDGLPTRTTASDRFAALAASLVFAVVAGTRGKSVFRAADAGHYLRIAYGDRTVMQPFASRQLGPLVVRAMAAAFHISVEHAFVAQGVISLLALTAFVFLVAVPRGTPRWVLLALVIVPFWPDLFYGLVLPDLWYAALLAVFLLFLQRERWMAAACMMLPLMVSRESTSLTLLCLLAVAWRELGWPGRLTAVMAAAAGALVTAQLSAHSPGNTEQLPGVLYMLLKVPWNGSRLFGIDPWSNKYEAVCTVPLWQMPLHLGEVTSVGICSIRSEVPLAALGALVTTFGLLPLFAFWLWRRQCKTARPRSVVLRFTLLYGGVSFLLAPLLGVSYERLFGYAWPLVLVALPLLVAERGSYPPGPEKGPDWRVLLSLHAAACAGVLLAPLLSAILGVLAWIAGYLLLQRQNRAGA